MSEKKRTSIGYLLLFKDKGLLGTTLTDGALFTISDKVGMKQKTKMPTSKHETPAHFILDKEEERLKVISEAFKCI